MLETVPQVRVNGEKKTTKLDYDIDELYRGVDTVNGFKIEYFEKPIKDIILSVDFDFESQSSSLVIVTHFISIGLCSGVSIITAFIKATNITDTHSHSTTIVGLNTFIKNDLKFICFINVEINDLSSHFHHDCCIHRNKIAIGDIIINIHKYNILINAKTHRTNISTVNTIVVHH